jgi:hypothetical protein
MIKASNNDGIWNDTPTTLEIQVLPPWWGTKTAISLYLFSLILLFYVLYKYVSIRVHEKRVLSVER